MPEKTKEAIEVTAVLVVMFCFFFWLGFFVGRQTHTGTGIAPVRLSVPAGERLSFQIARR